MPEPIEHLAIVGPGRAGLAMAGALVGAGAVLRLTIAGRAEAPPAHPIFLGNPPAVAYRQGVQWMEQAAPSAVLLAVPDAAIRRVADEIAALPHPLAAPVLHLSGASGRELLESLAARGTPTGSLHPLVAIPDAAAGEGLHGAWFAIEGEGHAIAMAERLVAHLHGSILRVAPEGKPLYHAAAVGASNFIVALLGVAERWMASAGVPSEQARPALVSLAAGAIRNVERRGPADALTGPVARGDVDTVRAHLGRLSATDRHLYSALAASTLVLARQRGLDSAAAEELAHLLEPIE